MRALHLSVLSLVLCGACAPSSLLRSPIAYEDAVPEPAIDDPRSLSDYVALAARRDPALRAAHARWRAAHERAQGASPWPRPVVTYSVFIRPVETRVGPQRQRIGLRVPIAWGGARRAERDAAAFRASGQGRVFAARLLALRARVAELYWSIWRLSRDVEDAQREVELVANLEESARIQLEVAGRALSEVQQLSLRRALALDRQLNLEAEREEARSRLRALVESDGEVEVLAAAPEQREAPPRREIAELVARRPIIAAHEDRALASEARARALSRSRYPGLSLNVDFIDVAPASADGVAGSGDNALSAGFALSVPVDARVLRRRAGAALAEAAAERAGAEAVIRDAQGELDALLVVLRNSKRRAALYEEVLAPQAEAAFESTLARFAVEGSLSEVLNAVDALFDVRRLQHRVLAEHALAWARLERLAGAPLSDAPTGEGSER